MSVKEKTIMKLTISRTKSFSIARIGLALAIIAGPVWAQEQKPKPTRYSVTDLGPLATVFSEATHVTNNGLAGGATILPNGTQHAVLWYGGRSIDIGTPGLGGPNSEAFGVNERGRATGAAEISTSAPYGEDFCGYGDHLVCLPFLWRNGVMTPLPTLRGGTNGEAGQINNRGEVAGNTENGTPDSTCTGLGTPQVLQQKPVIWENGEVRELPTYPGDGTHPPDPDGWAFGINDEGEVAGTSGVCSVLNQNTFVYVLSFHALLWEKDGTVHDLGNLGGTGLAGPGNVALELNNQGQVIGTSNLNDTTFHAFLWPDPMTGKMQDLGTLLGDADSGAISINDRGDVVGVSFDASSNPRAFLWQNGKMFDLNGLVANSPLYLLFAHGINSSGEIVGFGVVTTGASAGDLHAFLATPCNDEAAERDETTGRPRAVLPENAREILRQALRFGRFGTRPVGPQ
jgi:probable HAF family extracellular repeat protein